MCAKTAVSTTLNYFSMILIPFTVWNCIILKKAVLAPKSKKL